MSIVVDATQTAQEMVRLSQEVTESGLLEQVRELVATVDAYLRRGEQAARDLQPPAEHARPPVGEIGEPARDLGRQLRDHHTLVQSAARHAAELRAYVTDLEHLFTRLAA